MSTHKVEITNIGEVYEHPNADRLELAKVGETDWKVVIGKGQYHVGDWCIYIPIDSLLPEDLEEHLFPPDSKITLSKHRVRSIKIRGAMSQGMVIKLDDEFLTAFPKMRNQPFGTDVAEVLAVTKYEPPVRGGHGTGQKQGRKKKGHPDFKKYTDIENFKYYPKLFEGDEEVYITEKIHGTSARYAMLSTQTDSIWKKLKKFFHKLPEFEYVYGSRNVELKVGNDGGYYDSDVYLTIGNLLDLKNVLGPGEALYGEIVGSGIQKGYNYGCGDGQWRFFAYDVQRDGRYLDAPAFKRWCRNHEIERVPQLFSGTIENADLDELRSGPSTVLDSAQRPTQDVREGIVIKPIVEEHSYMGRKILKYLNDTYLLDDSNTDHH